MPDDSRSSRSTAVVTLRPPADAFYAFLRNDGNHRQRRDRVAPPPADERIERDTDQGNDGQVSA